MNHELYMTLYGHCWNELKQWIGSPANEYARMFAERLAGGCPTGAMKNDMDKAHMLFQDRTLTPRQRDAVRLLAVISNHRPIAWRRESKTPDGKPPLTPLTEMESLALWQQTREAASLFTSHLPKREGAALMKAIEGAIEMGTAQPQAAPPVPVMAVTTQQRRARWLDMFEAEEKREKRGALQRLADSEGVDRSNMGKDIAKAREERDTERRAGGWTAQLVQDGKRKP